MDLSITAASNRVNQLTAKYVLSGCLRGTATCWMLFKRSIHSQFNWRILLYDVIPDGKNWVNCAVLTGNSAGLRTVLSSRLSHTQRCAVHSGNPTVSSVYLLTPQWHHLKACNSFSRWASHDIFLFKYHFLLHILRFLFFFSDNIMADVASKQQTTALFLSTIVTRTRRHTKLTKKNWQTWWETCAVPENILFSFSCSYLTAQFNSECMGPFNP